MLDTDDHCAIPRPLATPAPAPTPARAIAEIEQLVEQFSTAMRHKLLAVESRRAWAADWRGPGWRDELTRSLLEHVRKGDPVDVANLCAFAWWHGWTTTPAAGADGWISVADRLPTHNHSVLGYVVGGGLTAGGDDPMIDVVGYIAPQWVQTVNGEDAPVAVSHWRQLPEPPAFAARAEPAASPLAGDRPDDCPVCGFRLAATADAGCVLGNCCYRPCEGTPEHDRVMRRREALAAAPVAVHAPLAAHRYGAGAGESITVTGDPTKGEAAR